MTAVKCTTAEYYPNDQDCRLVTPPNIFQISVPLIPIQLSSCSIRLFSCSNSAFPLFQFRFSLLPIQISSYSNSNPAFLLFPSFKSAFLLIPYRSSNLSTRTRNTRHPLPCHEFRWSGLQPCPSSLLLASVQQVGQSNYFQDASYTGREGRTSKP